MDLQRELIVVKEHQENKTSVDLMTVKISQDGKMGEPAKPERKGD